MKSKIFTKLVISVFIIIQAWFLYLTFNYPINGIIVNENRDNQWVINKFDTNSIGEELGLGIGDQILKVNGKDVNAYASIIKWRTLDQSQTITVIREGSEFKVSTLEIPYNKRNDVLPLIGEFISLFIAWVLYKRISSYKSAKYLSLVFVNIGLIFMSLGASMRGDIVGKIGIGTFMILLPIMFHHFFVVFLKEKGNITLPSRFIKYVYIVIVLSVLIQISYFFPALETYDVYKAMMMIIVIFFMCGLCLNFYFLVSIYVKHRKEKSYVATIIRTVVWSLLLSFFPLIGLSFIPQIFIGVEWVNPMISGWFTFIFPLTFAYLIVTKRVYDLDIFLRRIMITTVLALFPSALFICILLFVFPDEATFGKLFMIFIFFTLSLSCGLYSTEYFTNKLEPFMFPRKHQLQAALKKIAKNLSAISSFRELKEIILVDIVSALQVKGGAITFRYKDEMETISEGTIHVAEVEKLIASGQQEHPEYSLFELNRHEEYTSYLIVTQKKTKTLLGVEDTQWLKLIITYLTVSLENVHLIRKLTSKLQRLASEIPNEKAASDFIWFRKLMFELQEKERIRIATDLHDTTMQDLFFLKNRFTSLQEKNILNREDRIQMENIIDYIDIIHSNLRQSCYELHPQLLKEIGLIQSIEQLVELEMAVSSFSIEFHAVNAALIEHRGLEMKRHIFRIVQELINNAKKHSHASSITINLIGINQFIELRYEDDGVGFDPLRAAAKEIGSSGTGIEQLKSRVLSLNGHYKLETSRGRGMKFSAVVPLEEGEKTV